MRRAVVDINKSFSFAFADNQWVNKLGIGALITLIPILNFAWTGYTVELMRNVMKDAAEPLPTWDNLGQKLTDGLMLFVAGFVYVLPIVAVTCLPLSFMTLPAILSEYGDTQDIAEAIAAAGSAVFFCLLCVFFLYMLAFSAIYPAIMVLFAREGSLASCFKFGEVFNLIRRNASAFLIAWGVNIGLSLAASVALGILQTILGFILCVGWIAGLVLTFGVIVYTSVVSAHLFGQFGRIAFTGTDSLVPAQ